MIPSEVADEIEKNRGKAAYRFILYIFILGIFLLILDILHPLTQSVSIGRKARAWVDAVPMFVLIGWLDSVDKRARKEEVAWVSVARESILDARESILNFILWILSLLYGDV